MGGSRGPNAEICHVSLSSVLIKAGFPNKRRRMLMTSSSSQMTSSASSAEKGHLFLTVPAKIQGTWVYSHARLFATPWTARLLCPWDFPNRNTGVGCHSLLQGIFSAQGSNRCLWQLLHCRVGSSPLMPPGIPIWFNQVWSWRWCQSPPGHTDHKRARCVLPKRNPVLLPRKHKQLLSLHEHQQYMWSLPLATTNSQSPAGWVRGKGARPKRKRRSIYLTLIYFVVQQKLTQHYKAIIQYKIMFKKKKSQQDVSSVLTLPTQRQSQIPQVKGSPHRITGEGNSNPLQYSCLETPMDGRAW